jgi:hypothetical protein
MDGVISDAFCFRVSKVDGHNDKVTWRDDRLPALSATLKMGVLADVVFLDAV